MLSFTQRIVKYYIVVVLKFACSNYFGASLPCLMSPGNQGGLSKDSSVTDLAKEDHGSRIQSKNIKFLETTARWRSKQCNTVKSIIYRFILIEINFQGIICIFLTYL